MRKMRNSCEYEPWQNPSERPWRTLACATREFLLRGFDDESEGAGYWPYTVVQASQVHNAIHSINDKKGQIAHLRVPFCLAYAKTPPRYRNGKHTAQADRCMHLAFSRDKPGYILEILDGPRKGRIITSSQVKFRENVFPKQKSTVPGSTSTADVLLWDDISAPITICDDSDTEDELDPINFIEQQDDFDDDDEDPGILQSAMNSDNDDDEDENDSGYTPYQGGNPQNASARTTRSSSSLPDWRTVYNALDRGQRDGTINIMYTSCVDGKPAQVPGSAPKHFTTIKNIPDVKIRNEWYKSHFDENDGLFELEVLNIVPIPPNVTEKELLHLSTLYVMKPDGRKKARTVLSCGKGKLDPDDIGRTFSPTARPTTLRFLCANNAIVDGEIGGGGVKQAFAQANWPTTIPKIHAHIPFGYDKYYNGKLHCVEVGNLYGHPLAGRHWWLDFKQWMLTDGFKQSEWDPCFFIQIDPDTGDYLHIIVYVDDIITFSTHGSDMRTSWAKRFGKSFNWTDFGTDLHDFLSVRIRVSKNTVELDMERYIQALVKEHFPGGVHNEYHTPAVRELTPDVFEASQTRNTEHAKTPMATRFRKMVMQMLYVSSHVRPDISLAVGLLTRVQAWPNPTLLKHAEHVLIYLANTANLTLKYTKPKDDKNTSHAAWAPRVAVEGFSDASFEIAHSTSAFVYLMALAAISWIMKKQQTIALSTYEAEIGAGSLAGCEAIFVRGLQHEIGIIQDKPTILKMDSTSAIDLANDPVMHATSKHIARRDLFIRELVDRDIIKPIYIKTADNVADALTKPLNKGPFLEHRKTLLGH